MIRTSLEIIYEDEDLIAINKPHGLLVHRSKIAKDATEFALQLLRDQIGQRVYLTHRLDRKTSGVLLFAKNQATNQVIQSLFRERKVHKKYLAIVRGYISENRTIVYALDHEGKSQEAITDVEPVKNFEIHRSLNGFETSRYSLVELYPRTGRFHQLRKHMAHIFHPIIGDRPHGCNKQNRMWKQELGIDNMLLHAKSLSFSVIDNRDTHIQASPSQSFTKALQILESESTRTPTQ